jgi:hypothetical protein
MTTTASGGAPHGLSATNPFDRWFRYPAGFSPSSLTLALRTVYQKDQVGLLVDPFAGTASVGTETIKRGTSFIGLEAHPQIAELAALKFLRPADPSGLVDAATAVVDRSGPSPIDTEHELVRRCFDPGALSLLVGLREAVGSSHRWSNYLKWALLGTLRDVASVKVGWPYQRPALARTAPYRDPRKRFLQRARWMADDLAHAPDPLGSDVVAGDSRESRSWITGLQHSPADACVASPPYLNNFDYADATRLELYFWRVADSWRQMCDQVRSGMLVATTQQTRRPVAHVAADQLEIYPTFHRSLQPLIKQLEQARTQRGRGKEYDRVIAPYFLGIASVLSNLFGALRPSARCAWIIGDSAPYGIYIDTPALVGSLAQELGFELIDDVKVRPRGHRWRSNGVRHRVELTERLITFSRP